jgi:hypothetical protein
MLGIYPYYTPSEIYSLPGSLWALSVALSFIGKKLLRFASFCRLPDLTMGVPNAPFWLATEKYHFIAFANHPPIRVW